MEREEERIEKEIKAATASPRSRKRTSKRANATSVFETDDSVLETRTIELKSSVVLPATLENDLTARFSLPANQTMLLRSGRLKLAAGFRVTLHDGTPIGSDLQFSCANGLLFSSIRRLSVFVQGRPGFVIDDFGTKYIMWRYQQSCTAAATNGESEGFFLDQWPASFPGIEDSGQSKRRRLLQNSKIWYLRANLPIPHLENVELWPSSMQLALEIQYMNGSQLLFWPKSMTSPLKLELTDLKLCPEYFIMTRTPPVARPMIVAPYREDQLLSFQSMAGTRETCSPTFVLPSYPYRVIFLLQQADQRDDPHVNPFEFGVHGSIKFDLFISGKRYEIKGGMEDGGTEILANNRDILTADLENSSMRDSFETIFTRERLLNGWYCVILDLRRKQRTSEQITTVDTPAIATSCTVTFSTTHEKELEKPLFVMALFSFHGLARLDQDNQFTVETV